MVSTPSAEKAASKGGMDVDQARRYLGGVSRPVMYRLIKSGEVPHVLIGGRIILLKAQLQQFLARLVIEHQEKIGRRERKEPAHAG